MKYLILLLCLGSLFSCSENSTKKATGNDSTVAVIDQTTKADTAVEPVNQQRWLQEKVLSGVDFVASGNEPFWGLEISYENFIKFTTAEGDSIQVPWVEGIRLQEVAATGYRAEVESGPISIVVYDEKCIDDMSGFERPKKVEVLFRDQKYSGCGRFTYDYRLHDIWVLESINEKKLNASDFMKGLPRFEFNTTENRLTGHGGCNNFNGTIEVQGRKIKTGRFMSTRMACPNLETETRLLSSITNREIPYSLENMRLKLQLGGDSILVFKKVD